MPPSTAAAQLSSPVTNRNQVTASVSTTDAGVWLRKQLDSLKNELETSEKDLFAYKEDKNILSLALDDQSNMLREEMKQLNESLTAVRTKREEVAARAAELAKVRSDNPSKLNSVRQLVANLDQPGAAGNIHVVYLKNAEAVKVAQTLRAVLSGEAGSAGQSGTGTVGSSNSGSSFAPNTTGSTGQNTTTGMGSTPSFGSGSGTNTAGGTGNGMVQADPMTNSLIVTAPDAIYNNIRKVIDQLDKRRAQVYVEALITEVSTDKAAEIGIQWQAGKLGSTSWLMMWPRKCGPSARQV